MTQGSHWVYPQFNLSASRYNKDLYGVVWEDMVSTFEASLERTKLNQVDARPPIWRGEGDVGESAWQWGWMVVRRRHAVAMDCMRCCNCTGLRRSEVKGRASREDHRYFRQSCPVVKHLSPSSTFPCHLPGEVTPTPTPAVEVGGRGGVCLFQLLSLLNAREKLILGSQSFLFPDS